MIWHAPPDLGTLNAQVGKGLTGLLGITFTKIGADFISAAMPVTPQHHQPLGLLHGGASVALAETLGSVAGWLTLDREKEMCLGLEINANHIRAMRTGLLTGTARPLHLGRTTQVWEIRMEEEDAKLVCISRITLAVRPLA